jgi:hypothetical protein
VAWFVKYIIALPGARELCSCIVLDVFWGLCT